MSDTAGTRRELLWLEDREARLEKQISGWSSILSILCLCPQTYGKPLVDGSCQSLGVEFKVLATNLSGAYGSFARAVKLLEPRPIRCGLSPLNSTWATVSVSLCLPRFRKQTCLCRVFEGWSLCFQIQRCSAYTGSAFPTPGSSKLEEDGAVVPRQIFPFLSISFKPSKILWFILFKNVDGE